MAGVVAQRDRPGYAPRPPMLAYVLVTFTGAFLLFFCQPLMGRFLLPWFGGGAAVWTVTLLFFQLLVSA